MAARQRLSELLYGPLGRRMGGDVVMKNLPRTQDGHQPSGGIVRAVRLNRALPEKGQLFSEEEILGRQPAAGSSEEEDKPTEVDQHLANGPEAVNKVP
jgi:hypothetical protein